VDDAAASIPIEKSIPDFLPLTLDFRNPHSIHVEKYFSSNICRFDRI
jgi:hypothetical protein